ncbi:MAG TPA: hypothetical protein VFY96_08280 [Candidatus Binatia bacterium]|nr:hypothetical protein [Candidatus Binatia bacterium]
MRPLRRVGILFPTRSRGAHREFSINGAAASITELGELATIGGKTSFIFSEPDRKWWELSG